MRHRVSGYKLGRKTGSRKALYRILLNECIKRGKIRTTMSKAKAVQPKLEKLITLGRKGSVNDKRKAYSIVNNTEITDELFNVVSKVFLYSMYMSTFCGSGGLSKPLNGNQ